MCEYWRTVLILANFQCANISGHELMANFANIGEFCKYCSVFLTQDMNDLGAAVQCDGE
jgi:hypothetical protein